MTEYVKKSDVLELLSLPKDLIDEYVCDLKGLWIDDDEAEQTEPSDDWICATCKHIGDNTDECRECGDGGHYEYKPKQTEPQTMYYPQVDGIIPSVIEPQTDRNMAVGKRSDATADKYNLYGKTTTDEPQAERSDE